ncbi:MAG: hypothetical protein GX450_01040 [Verrucomicrobia bacterium]|nr:hypothetical protein [Verrucomicrobiota bacterium]
MSNVFLKALDSAVAALVGPQNAATPTVVETPQSNPSPSTPYRGARKAGSLDQPGPLSPEAQRELTATLRPALPPDALAGVPWPSPAQQRAFDALLKQRGYTPPKRLAAQLAALDAPWLRLQQAMTEAASSQTSKYHAHLADIAARTAAGDSTVHKEDGWSREDWISDSRERLHAFKAECRKIEAQAWQIAEPALLAKADAADAAADELEAEARPRFEQFAVAYRPAPYVLLLRKYAATLRDGSRRNVGKPSAMIETL